jgi:hypothetical protein
MFRFRSSSFGYGGGVSTKDKTDDLEALLEMEKSFWKSAGDQGFYRKNMAPEGKVIMSMGVLDKEGVVASMSDAEPQESFDIHNPAGRSLRRRGCAHLQRYRPA